MGLANQGITPGRTTLLEAINVLLENIGEQPVDSNEKEQIQDARIAENTILELHREGQLRAWSWNSEEFYPFEKDKSTKEIVVPANVVRFTVDPYFYDGRFILRGQKVYDKWKRTTKLDDDITEVKANVVWQLTWDESPEAFNRYTTIRAARVFAARVMGSDSIVKYTSADEQAALTELMRVELDQSQPNALTGGRGLGPMPTYQPGQGLLRGVYGGTVIG
jgi:hypothetical protein